MEYKFLKDNPVTILQLVKPEITKKYYEIVVGNDRYASIDLLHDEGTLVRLETAVASYTIKRMGFFLPYVTLRKDKDVEDLAMSKLNLNGKSTITFNGNSYSFTHFDLWKNQWAWLNDKNKFIIKYKLTTEGPLRGQIEVSKEAFYNGDLELLMALGSYYLLQLDDELALQNVLK